MLKTMSLRKFDSIAHKITKSLEDFIEVEDIGSVAFKSDRIIYETSPILRRPEGLFKKTKEIVLRKIASNDGTPEKVKIKEALEDCPKLHCQDSNLTETLIKLFEGNEEASFEVQIDLRKEPLLGMNGEFILPREFTEIAINGELHYSYPQIKLLVPRDEKIKQSISNLKKNLEDIKDFYARKQKAIETFKENLSSIKSFGTIVICPAECTTDDNNLDMPTLDEAIEHECQHLCIFLMSIAKTCIYFGLHFSNAVYKKTLKYQLRETEFITLFGSYSNILKRIYKQMPEPKDKMTFIKTAINLAISNNDNVDEKCKEALLKSMQWTRIADFYRAIFEDSKLSLLGSKGPIRSIQQQEI